MIFDDGQWRNENSIHSIVMMMTTTRTKMLVWISGFDYNHLFIGRDNVVFYCSIFLKWFEVCYFFNDMKELFCRVEQIECYSFSRFCITHLIICQYIKCLLKIRTNFFKVLFKGEREKGKRVTACFSLCLAKNMRARERERGGRLNR